MQRTQGGNGAENNPPQREPKRERTALKMSDFSWQPNSLTAVLGRGRPVGVQTDRTGALLVADDVGNVVWRVSSAN